MSYSVPSRRERKKQLIRDDIYRGAVDLIVQQGVTAVTVETLCHAADVSRMTFYKYYKSRHELLAKLCHETVLEPLSKVFQYMISRQNTCLEQQLRSFEVFLNEWFHESNRLQRELVVYMVSRFEPQDDDLPELQAFLSQQLILLYSAYRDELLPDLNPEFCATTTTGSVAGLIFCWLNEDDYPIESRLRQLTEYLIDSLIADSPRLY